MPSQLKMSFQEDIETLKKLNLDILPSKIYYPKLVVTSLLVFLSILGAQAVACLFALQIGAWSDNPAIYIENHEEAVSDIDFDYEFEKSHIEFDQAMFHDTKKFEKAMKKLEAEKIQEIKESDRRIREQIEGKHRMKTVSMILGVIASSCFYMIFFVGKINYYVIFNLQVQKHLQTGEYLQKKIKLAYKGFFIIFLILSCFFFSIMDQEITFFAGIPAFIFSGLVCMHLIDMETNRIGVSLISSAITNFFQKREEAAAAKNT